MRLVAARTRDGVLIGGRGGESQQFGQRRGPRLMHRRTHRHFDGLQIQTPRLAPTLEDDAQQLVYFARNLPLDRFRRFFSSGESVSATGRARQICALTSTNSRCRLCSLRNSAISRSAFRSAAW